MVGVVEHQAAVVQCGAFRTADARRQRDADRDARAERRKDAADAARIAAVLARERERARARRRREQARREAGLAGGRERACACDGGGWGVRRRGAGDRQELLLCYRKGPISHKARTCRT
jgi:hypothetical protein